MQTRKKIIKFIHQQQQPQDKQFQIVTKNHHKYLRCKICKKQYQGKQKSQKIMNHQCLTKTEKQQLSFQPSSSFYQKKKSIIKQNKKLLTQLKDAYIKKQKGRVKSQKRKKLLRQIQIEQQLITPPQKNNKQQEEQSTAQKIKVNLHNLQKKYQKRQLTKMKLINQIKQIKQKQLQQMLNQEQQQYEQQSIQQQNSFQEIVQQSSQESSSQQQSSQESSSQSKQQSHQQQQQSIISQISSQQSSQKQKISQQKEEQHPPNINYIQPISSNGIQLSQIEEIQGQIQISSYKEKQSSQQIEQQQSQQSSYLSCQQISQMHKQQPSDLITVDQFNIQNKNSLQKQIKKVYYDLQTCKQKQNSKKKQIWRTLNKIPIQMYLLYTKKCSICSLNYLSNKKMKRCLVCSSFYHNKCLKLIKKKCCIICQSVPNLNFLSFYCDYLKRSQLIVRNSWLFQTSNKSLKMLKLNDKQLQRAKIKQKEISNFFIKRRCIYIRISQYLIDKNQQTANQIDARSNPCIRKSSKSLQKCYNQYCLGWFPPLELFEINQQVGYGLRTFKKIPKNTFLLEYGGLVIPSKYVFTDKTNAFELWSEESPKKQSIINCSLYSTAGCLINHSTNQQKINCQTMIVFLQGKIRNIMYSNRQIMQNQQLLYNYNGRGHYYPTQNYQQL